MKHVIRLEKMHVGNSRLNFQFTSTLSVFKKKSFFVEYGRAILKPEVSLNAIPFAAVMAPIAWASGADLIIPSLDKTYLRSLERAKEYWKKCYPHWPFTSQILTTEEDYRGSGQTREGILFSGGLDSLATLIHNLDKKPELFTVIGADLPHTRSDYTQRCKKEIFGEAARRSGCEITYIRTNIQDALDLKALECYAANWFGAVEHGLLLTSLTVPISYGYLKTLFIAGCSHKVDYRHPCGGDHEVVKGLGWAGTEVQHDLNGVSRVEKIKHYLKPHPEFYDLLRVCWMQHREINCGRCEKCLRTICELLINDLDPNRFNFTVDNDTLVFARFKLERRFYLFFRGNEAALDYWRTIQWSIDPGRIPDRYGSKAFFVWLSGFKKLQRRQSTLKLACWLAVLAVRDLFKRVWSFPAIAD